MFCQPIGWQQLVVWRGICGKCMYLGGRYVNGEIVTGMTALIFQSLGQESGRKVQDGNSNIWLIEGNTKQNNGRRKS